MLRLLNSNKPSRQFKLWCEGFLLTRDKKNLHFSLSQTYKGRAVKTFTSHRVGRLYRTGRALQIFGRFGEY